MKRRAPLAPLHSNSLHADSPRRNEDVAKRESRKPITKAESKTAAAADAKAKSATLLLQAQKAARIRTSSRANSNRSNKALSPAKFRRSAALVTTTAQTQASKPPRTARSALNAATAQPKPADAAVSAEHAAANAQTAATPQPPVAAVTNPGHAQPHAGSPDALSHWYIPDSQPNLDAILSPFDTPVASRRDTMYFPTRQATPASDVPGLSTPQDFSDVFDLESVSGHTPGGCATFVGRRDSTPGLILGSPADASPQKHEQSLHQWLSGSPGTTPTLAQGPSPQETSSPVLKPSLATPAAAQVLKGLKIKTPQLGSNTTASRLRNSPFLSQLLRTAPSLSPATSTPSPSLGSKLTGPPSMVGVRLTPSPTAGARQRPSPTVGARLAVRPGRAVSSGSPASPAIPSPAALSVSPAPSSSLESAGSNALNRTASGTLLVASSECVTPQLSESAAESAIRQALVKLASSDKVIRLASPVDLDASHGANPHAAMPASEDHALPVFTLAALDSPVGASATLTRQPSGSVNGPEASTSTKIEMPSSPEGQQAGAPFQEVVQQLLSSPKMAITGADAASSDKTPYQTLLQHLMGGGRVSANSPLAGPSVGIAPASSIPVLCPAVQATPARHRLAQTTYRTPSTAATGQGKQNSPSPGSFQFACSPASDNTSPLATFLQNLSHATYEASPASSPAEEKADATSQAAKSKPQEVQNDSTPYQDFMKYLTQATYHSPGTKAEPEGQASPVQFGQVTAQTAVKAAAAAAADSPLRLGKEGLSAWLCRNRGEQVLNTPARHQLQEVCEHAGEVQHLRQLAEETGTVKEENGALRGQLADIQASLAHLTAANSASLQDAEEQRQAAAAEAGKAKQMAQQLLTLAHTTGQVTEAYEVERQSLKRAVVDAQQRLYQAEAASKDAEAASQSQQDSLAQDLAQARLEVRNAEGAAQAKDLELTKCLEDKAALHAGLQAAERQLADAQAAAAATGDQKDLDLGNLADQLKEAHEALFRVQSEQQQTHSSLAADLTHYKQDNARLCTAIAEAQQQLKAAAAAAAQQALAEQDLSQQQQTRLALQQAHLQALQEAQAAQAAKEQENAALMLQLQEVREQLAQASAQPVSLQIAVVDDSSRPVTALVTPAKRPARPDFAAVSLSATPLGKSLATPQAAAAAAQLLRGFSMSQQHGLGIEFGVEPEWPPCPPPSMAPSPVFSAYDSGFTESALARLFSLELDLTPRRLQLLECDAASGDAVAASHAQIESMHVLGSSPQHPRAPAPTPAGTPMQLSTRPIFPSALSLSAESILAAFDLASEQLRSATTPSTSRAPVQGTDSSPSPVATALGRLHAATTPSSSGSPVVKTTRQVPSVLAAVAQLEAAQGLPQGRPRLPFAAKAGPSRFLTPTGPPTRPDIATVTDQSGPTSSRAIFQAAPAVTNLANPLFSPSASMAGGMLTPYYTPMGLDEMRLDNCVTPCSGGQSMWQDNMAGDVSSPAVAGSSMSEWRGDLTSRLGTPVAGGLAAITTPTAGGLMTPGTPGSGVVTGGWSSVTERLQALRAQLQSAQKKLASTTQMPGAAASPGMALSDITASYQQHSRPSPAATDTDQHATASDAPSQRCRQHVVGVKTPADGVSQHASGLRTPTEQGIAEASVQEQCLSAETWLRGLAEECLAKLHTPVPLPAAGLPAHQAEMGLEAGRQITPRGLVSHPVPTSPSVWDEMSVLSSPTAPDCHV